MLSKTEEGHFPLTDNTPRPLNDVIEDVVRSENKFLTGLSLGSGAPKSRVTRSQSIGKLTEALAKARLQFKKITKDTKNPYYGSMYADLEQIIDATYEGLSNNGLVVFQFPTADISSQRAVVVTLLSHSSGEWVESGLEVPSTGLGKDGKVKFDSQTTGSATSYARRYAYMGILNVSPEASDDGNAASHDRQQPSAPRRAVNHEPAQPTNKPRPNSDRTAMGRPTDPGRPAAKHEPVQSAPKTFTEEIEAESSAAQRYNPPSEQKEPEAAGEVLPTKKELDEYIAKVKAAKKGKEAFLELCGAPADTDTKKLTKAQWEIGLKKLESKQ